MSFSSQYSNYDRYEPRYRYNMVTQNGLDDNMGNIITIGDYAGFTFQGYNSIAIGTNAGYANQGTNSIAIGSSAGEYTQGENSISI